MSDSNTGIPPLDPTPPDIDPVALRRAFGTFVTGVTVVTTLDANGSPRGMTANSFTSVSLDPPLLLICVAKSASSFPAFANADSFAVNLLHEGQTEVSKVFASKSADKFAAVDHDIVHTGSPVLTDSLSWFDCTVHDRVDAGDHQVVIGRVKAFGTSPSAPLGFCRGRYATVKEPLPSGWHAQHDMIVGYLVEAGGAILLQDDGRDGWVLPTARQRKVDGELRLAEGSPLKLLPDTTFLYSVFDVADSDPGYLIYRAQLVEDGNPRTLPGDLRLFDIAEIPFEQIAARELRSMLRRYLREREDGRFGIYMGSDDGGRLAMIDGEARHWLTADQA